MSGSALFPFHPHIVSSLPFPLTHRAPHLHHHALLPAFYLVTVDGAGGRFNGICLHRRHPRRFGDHLFDHRDARLFVLQRRPMVMGRDNEQLAVRSECLVSLLADQVGVCVVVKGVEHVDETQTQLNLIA